MYKDIKGYEGIYQVSENGVVIRIGYNPNEQKKKKIPYELNQAIDKDGYRKVSLYKDGKIKNFFVHRLVAIAFIDNPENKSQINHINGVKNDNNVHNLEWVTQSENRKHCLEFLNPKLRNNKLSTPVYQYSLEGELLAIYPSAKEVQRSIGYWQTKVSKAIRENKIYKGFIWTTICNNETVSTIENILQKSKRSE